MKLDIEKIINYIGENRIKITRYTLLSLIVMFVAGIGYLAYAGYEKYNIIQEKSSKLAIVSDASLIKVVKENKLRNIDTVLGTVKVLHNVNLGKNSVAKIIILSMYKVNAGEKYGDSIKSYIFDGIKNQEDLSIENILNNIDNKEALYNLVGDDIAAKILENFDNLLNSNLVLSYLNSFPDISKQNISGKGVKALGDVLSKLYVYEIIFIESNLDKEYKKFDDKLKTYQAPYDNFLSYILFPPMNIWTDKYSGKINVDLFGSKYLSKAGYIDINLIAYWTDFFKYAYKGKAYRGKTNEIEDISIGKIKKYQKNGIDNVVSLPIKVKFGVKSDSSFYGLVSKLTSTSNKKNVMLISEFTYYLWDNIKNNISSKISNLKDEYKDKPIGYVYMISLLDDCSKNNCNKLFNCKGNCNLASIINESNYKESLTGAYYNIAKGILKSGKSQNFVDSTFNKYFTNSYYQIDNIDKLIGARLTDCINGGYCDDILSVKKKGDIVASSIEDFAGCEKGSMLKCTINPSDKTCNMCRYKFANKFNTNYFITYTLLNDINNKSYSFVSRIKDVYNNIPGLLELGKFKFNKVESVLYAYKADVDLNVYYRFISNKDLNEILTYIGQNKCPNITNKKAWNINMAYNYLSSKINNLYNVDLGANELYDLKKLQEIINDLKSKYKKSNNLDKLLSALQVYRIFVERGYCKNN